jgi:hypothetical protein
MDADWRGVTQGNTTTDNGSSGIWGCWLIDLDRGMDIEAGRAGTESSADGSGHRNMISGRGTETELSAEEISLAWATDGGVGSWRKTEGVGDGTSSSRRIETKASTPLTCLNGLLVLLDLMRENFRLELLSLEGLKPDHLELDHLQLKLGVVDGLGRIERRTKGVHGTGSSLLGRETVVVTIDSSGHGEVPVVIDVALGHVANVVSFILVWEGKHGGKLRVGEGAGGGRTHATCPETGEKGGTVVGRHGEGTGGLRGE